MEFSLLRIYLLLGLLAHKAVWEAMKRGLPAAPPKRASLKTRLLSGIKILVLAAIMIQTVLPELVPIANDPYWLRAAGAAIYTLGLLTAISARMQLGRNWSDIEKSY